MHGEGTNNGTSALHLALLAAKVGRGDEVITVPFTFVASVAAIYYCGAKTVFVDIDARTYTMDPAAVDAAITPRTKVIMPVHLTGSRPTWTQARIDRDRGRGAGAWCRYSGRRIGSLGDICCFSFYPGKNRGAFGEGGMVVTAHASFTPCACCVTGVRRRNISMC